jgi:phosphoribosyl-ATP pyrophosphohydrolase/phosphoribosyl-AMP cyclohydrolase
MTMNFQIDELKFDDSGLIPAIIQEASTKRVVMFAWMNSESIRQSLKIGETVFFSRSRQELWHKGATSGNTQSIQNIEVDCDQDVLLISVKTNGPACHIGSMSCFDAGCLVESNVD